MNESQTFGFAKLVPGFDFLQNLAKGAAGAQSAASPMSNWIAPTLSVEELDKRIQDLRAVQFWLEQNGKALAATIQALEVQKMTLATLQGMNLGMKELAESLKFKPGAAPASASPASSSASFSSSSASAHSPSPAEAAQPSPSAGGKSASRRRPASAAASSPAAAMSSAADPMQWWGALSHQFQQIAQSALQEVAASGAAGGTSGAPAASKPSRAPARATRSAAPAPDKAAKPRKAATPAKRAAGARGSRPPRP